VLDADIKSCFDEIDQDALMVLIERRVCDRALLKLLRSWLRAGIIEGGVYSDVSSGTPQGSPISPLLCNIALGVLDEELTKARNQTGKLIRFADDWVVGSQLARPRLLLRRVSERLGPPARDRPSGR
jgi:RNA-directed DNA polymerase